MQKIERPGLYLGVPEAEYHADPCPEPSLSSTIAKTLLASSPLHAAVRHPRLARQQQKVEREAFDRGKVAHAPVEDKLHVIELNIATLRGLAEHAAARAPEELRRAFENELAAAEAVLANAPLDNSAEGETKE